MVTTKLYLDTRKPSLNGECQMKVTMTLRGKSAHLPLGVRLLPTQWDSTRLVVINHTHRKTLTAHLQKLKLDIDDVLLDLRDKGKLKGLSVTEIKDLVNEVLHPENTSPNSFYGYFVKFGKSHKAQRTRDLYEETATKLKKYKRGVSKLAFEDITVSWLMEFEKFLSKTEKSANSRNIHLRNIRSAFNSAIDEEITNFYPFRKFKIRPTATKKRSLLVEQLRTFFAYKGKTEAEEWAVDIMKLSFLLIGINTIDLCNLTELKNGRIEYTRSKTQRDYSVLVPPEALVLINKHRGKKYLIDALERHNSVNSVTTSICRYMRFVKENIKGMPKISMYWMRHSWATIAAELDIPKETIAAGLGHGGNTVTDIYINFSQKKVDQANRIVIDHILNKIR